ncbi:MAG: 2-hydroxyacyl-CoA dehydratase family protein [Clostridiales bacterium]|jgi:hypothetical protein|nr:2-hydroxyacyl-CoA dehydratase family protein [Clostridiales bacterium]
MRIGFYCPLIGAEFLKSLHVSPVDLRTITYENVNYNLSQSGSNKCCVIRAIASAVSDNQILDGIILTNCCHEQEQLADTLSKTNVRAYTINIPRVFNEDSIQYLFEQIEYMVGNSFSGAFDVAAYLRGLAEEPVSFEPRANRLPVYVSGVSLPSWFESLLDANKLNAVIRRKCGRVSPEGLKVAGDIVGDLVGGIVANPSGGNLDFKEISKRFSCMRDMSSEAEITSLKNDINAYSPIAAIFVSMEFCVTSSYYYMKFREQFLAENIPVFKINIADWNKPSMNVVTQIETIAQMCRRKTHECLL